MKRFLALMLVFAMALSLCACKSGKKRVYTANDDDDDDDDILIGKWERIADKYRQAILEFTMDDDTISGKWTIYNYADETWSERTFTVKERTDDSITLLLNDGTLSVIPYTMLDYALFFDVDLYYNTESTLPDVENDAEYMLHNGNIYKFYDNLCIGMHYDCLKAAYPELSEINDYNSASLCSFGDFDSAIFWFTKNGFLRSVHLSEFDEDATESFLTSFIEYADAEFGTYSFHSRQDDENADVHYKYYEWELDAGTIQLSASIEAGKPAPNWVSVDYTYY